MAKRDGRVVKTKEGKLYLLRMLDLRKGLVTCWGEVCTFDGHRSTHGEDLVFSRADVEIVEGASIPHLDVALVRQGMEALRAAGHHVTMTRRGNYIITRRATPEAQAAHDALTKDLAEVLLPSLRKLSGLI